MDVFISWSGSRSQGVAEALKHWLPHVINEIKPFVSSEDIDAGARWLSDINTRLQETNFGIICVTAENQQKPWLNFEAGALAKAVESSRVVPLAIDLKTSDIKAPLGQFQAKPLSRKGIEETVTSLNNVVTKPLPEAQLTEALDVWWPKLHEQLDKLEAEADAGAGDQQPHRSERDLLEEVLDTVRGLARTGSIRPRLLSHGELSLSDIKLHSRPVTWADIQASPYRINPSTGLVEVMPQESPDPPDVDEPGRTPPD